MTNASKAVFLSYASQDAEAAARICASLRAAGIEVWFDQSELRGGDAWDYRIRRQVRDCALFIPFIVPVCVDGTRDSEAEVPESFLKAQWTRLPNGETSRDLCAPEGDAVTCK